MVRALTDWASPKLSAFATWGEEAKIGHAVWALAAGFLAGLLTATFAFADDKNGYLEVVAFYGVLVAGTGSFLRAIAHGRKAVWKGVDYFGKLMAIGAFMFTVVALTPQVTTFYSSVLPILWLVLCSAGLVYLVIFLQARVDQLAKVRRERLKVWRRERIESDPKELSN